MSIPSYGRALIEEVCEHLEMRACDPWDDNLWPAANKVLTMVVAELRRKDMSDDLVRAAWRRFNKNRG